MGDSTIKLLTNENDMRIGDVFAEYAERAETVIIASAYCSLSQVTELLPRAASIKIVALLDLGTSPEALRDLISQSHVQLRYYTREFPHSKIFAFDNGRAAIIGSANFTSNGFYRNNETCIIVVDCDLATAAWETADRYWQAAEPLSSSVIDTFSEIIAAAGELTTLTEAVRLSIERRIGRHAPTHGGQQGADDTANAKAEQLAFVEYLKIEIPLLLRRRGGHVPEQETEQFQRQLLKTYGKKVPAADNNWMFALARQKLSQARIIHPEKISKGYKLTDK